MNKMVSMKLLMIVLVSLLSQAQADEKQVVMDYLDQHSAGFSELAMSIWDYAELGYLEMRSSALLQKTLQQAGFEVESNIAGIPTAFIASYGQGEPVVGILAEFDALPGISQAASPTRSIVEGKHAGHACGHHLFGVGSMAAAMAVSRWMKQNGTPGTLKLYGTPAEEGGSGKVYMVREGAFKDVDAVLHWHPSDRNVANPGTSLANKSARARFYGQSSHAAAAPERGRSALDGVEAMNFMVNMLREHVPSSTRIHYVITSGGAAPNVVPDFAEVYYYVRHPDAETLLGIWDRVMQTAKAAALGTGTEVSIETMHGNHSLLPNQALAKVMHANLSRVGGYTMDESEIHFAKQIETSFTAGKSLLGLEQRVLPMRLEHGKGSTDVGDVSWIVPTTGMSAATWVPGTSAHSWQAIAAGGTSIGAKGMLVAAKALALTAMDVMTDAQLRSAALAEFDDRRGVDFHYQALLGNRAPPLDYRLPSKP